MDLLGRLQRTGIRRGLLGDSRAWTVVAIAVLGIRLIRRISGDGTEVVYCEELEPGTSLLVTHTTEARS